MIRVAVMAFAVCGVFGMLLALVTDVSWPWSVLLGIVAGVLFVRLFSPWRGTG